MYPLIYFNKMKIFELLFIRRIRYDIQVFTIGPTSLLRKMRLKFLQFFLEYANGLYCKFRLAQLCRVFVDPVT